MDTEPLEDTDGVYEQFPEQFHDVADALRVRRIPTGGKARLGDLLADADELFSHDDVPVVAALAVLAGTRETARRRLRLLLCLDAMMLWQPDSAPGADSPRWAAYDGSRAILPDLDIPDLLVHRKGSEDDRP